MKKLLLTAILLVSSLGWAGTCGSGYSFSIPLKLHKAVNSDQTNFAVPINVRDARLATVANGGNIQNTVSNSLSRTVPADLVICPDQTLTSTPLKYETESYGATYGDWAAFIQTPTLTFASYVTVYLYANNASVTTDQEDLTMWSDLFYALVLHLPNGSTLDMKDSSGNANNGTMAGTVPVTKVGAWDGAAGNDSNTSSWSNSNFIEIPSSSTYKQTNNVTWEAWANLTSGGSNFNKMYSLDYRANGTWNPPYGIILSLDNAGTHVNWHTVIGGAEKTLVTTSTLIGGVNGVPGGWQKVDGTFNGTTMKAYLSGVQDATTLAASGTIDYGTSANLTIGQRSQYSPGENWAGDLDEIRIRNVVSSDDYIATSAALSPYTSTFEFTTQTAAAPVRQYQTCGINNTATTCTLPFDITAGGVLVAMVQMVDKDCGTVSMPNDSLGNVYTRQVRSDYTGTLHHYYNCIYTGPITSIGTDVVTTPNPGGTANVSMTVYEVKGITVSGIQTTNTDNTAPPATMTLTSGQADTFVICGTRHAIPGVSQAAYTFYAGIVSSTDDHPAQTAWLMASRAPAPSPARLSMAWVA
jgi:hypothetical protein